MGFWRRLPAYGPVGLRSTENIAVEPKIENRSGVQRHYMTTWQAMHVFS
jgi:hypothetical protein